MKTQLLLLAASLPLFAASIGTASAAVGITAGGVTVDFAAVPSGADFASVSVSGTGAGDLTVLGTGANGIDNATTGISASLAWPAADTVWTAAANSIATEPTASNLLAGVRHIVTPGKMLTGPTGNRFQALIGRFQNLSGIPVGSLDLSWTLGSPVDSAGTGAVGTDPLAGIHVYFSKTGAIGSWTRLNGPFGTPDGPVATATITVPGKLGINGELYIAWIDDNGPGSGTPNFDGNYTVDDVVISNVVQATCSVSAVVTGPARTPGVNPADPADDRVTYSATINGTGAVGPGWVVAAGPSLGTTGTYGTALNLDLPVTGFSGGPITLRVRDQSDVDCYFETLIRAPAFLHRVSATSSPTITFTPAAVGDGSYVAPLTTLTEPGWSGGTTSTATTASNVQVQPLPSTQTLKYFHMTTNGTSLTTDPVDVNALKGSFLKGEVELSLYTTSTTGLDAGDAINSRIEVAQDGDFSNTTAGNIITMNIKDVPATDDATAFGATIAAANPYINFGTAAGQTPFPSTDFTFHKFSATMLIPAAATNPHARIIVQSITGITNTEHLLIDNIVFKPNTDPSLEVTVAGPGTWTNNGTVVTTDDSFTVPVNISGLNLGASPGWNSNETPVRSGLYTDANPVTFGPYPARTPVNVQFSDQMNPAVTSGVIAMMPPAITFTLTPNTNLVVRNINGPGDADDTVTFELMISGTNGGPEFRMDSYPTVATTPSLALTPVPVNITVTLSPIPDQGTLLVIFRDASYLTTTGGILVPVPPPAVVPTQYIIGQKDLGAGLSDVLTDPALPLAPEWMNFPGIRALEMTNGLGVPAKTVTSERIDLTGVSGNVNFSARLRAIDLSTGSEAADTFLAELILDDNAGSPVNLITAYDTFAPANGVMNGGGTAAEDEFNIAQAGDGTYISDFNLSYTIPDNVTSARLVITAVNDSNNETFVVENVLFAVSSGSGDADGDGVSDANEATMGTSPNDPNDVLRLSQNPDNANQITFPTRNGRFYRVYVSDDADEASHLTKWKDTQLATFVGNGSTASFNITVAPGEARRFYRLHVMTTDGTTGIGDWPATVP